MSQPSLQPWYRTISLVASAFLSTISGAFCEETITLPFSGTKMDFVWVPVDAPGGVKNIEIGDFSGNHRKEKRRNVSVYAPFEKKGKRGYYLGKTEVTEEHWNSVMEQGPRSKFPVTGRTYAEVQVFLDKLNAMTRKKGSLPRTPSGVEGFLKLPTEPEWEYAARGAEGASYADQDPYGGDLERYEVFSLSGSDGKAKEAASRPANALGLHDMLGNVRELMSEDYSVGTVSGGGHLLKGGSYLSQRSELRSSSRTEHRRVSDDGKPVQRRDAGLRLCISAELITALGQEPPFPPDDFPSPEPQKPPSLEPPKGSPSPAAKNATASTSPPKIPSATSGSTPGFVSSYVAVDARGNQRSGGGLKQVRIFDVNANKFVTDRIYDFPSDLQFGEKVDCGEYEATYVGDFPPARKRR